MAQIERRKFFKMLLPVIPGLIIGCRLPTDATFQNNLKELSKGRRFEIVAENNHKLRSRNPLVETYYVDTFPPDNGEKPYLKDVIILSEGRYSTEDFILLGKVIVKSDRYNSPILK